MAFYNKKKWRHGNLQNRERFFSGARGFNVLTEKVKHEPEPKLPPITEEERLNMTDEMINEENERDYKA